MPDHKGEGDIFVQASKHTPQQLSFLVLTPTVVCVEVDVLLAEPMYFKEAMEHAVDGIGSLIDAN